MRSKRTRVMIERAKTASFVTLILLTLAMVVRDQLPASEADVKRLAALAGSSKSAIEVMDAGLVANPDPTKGQVRRLSHQVQAAANARESDVHGTASGRKMLEERMRLANVPFVEMSGEDHVRVALFWLSEHAQITMAVFIVALLYIGRWAFLRLSRRAGHGPS